MTLMTTPEAVAAQFAGVEKRVKCWACNDCGWVQRGPEIVKGELFSKNHKPCEVCSIALSRKERDA